MARGRDTTAGYGGYDSVDLGPAYIKPSAQIPEPHFTYGELTRENTSLWSTGVSYQVRRAGGGMFALGMQKEHYEATAVMPGTPRSRLSDDPYRMYGQASVVISGHTMLYSSYVQGFEDSGVAPSTAANAGAILPTARTWQVDGGLHYTSSRKLNLIAGVFELNRPYFNFDMDNVDRQLGLQRASGLELSMAGQLATGLNINAGCLIGRVQIIGSDLATQGVGGAAVGHPRDQEQVNAVYALPQLPGLSVDVLLVHFGSAPATVSDAAYVPQATLVSFGERYQFEILAAPATFRVQLQNAFNVYAWNVGYSPGFFQRPPRTVFAYLDIDLSGTSDDSDR
jgi:iron complex outermembrane receptor protein